DGARETVRCFRPQTLLAQAMPESVMRQRVSRLPLQHAPICLRRLRELPTLPKHASPRDQCPGVIGRDRECVHETGFGFRGAALHTAGLPQRDVQRNLFRTQRKRATQVRFRLAETIGGKQQRTEVGVRFEAVRLCLHRGEIELQRVGDTTLPHQRVAPIDQRTRRIADLRDIRHRCFVHAFGSRAVRANARTRRASLADPHADRGIHIMPVCNFASSDIMDWFQGGSNTRSICASLIVGIISSLVRASSTRMSPMPQPGAVSVSLTYTLRCPSSRCSRLRSYTSPRSTTLIGISGSKQVRNCSHTTRSTSSSPASSGTLSGSGGGLPSASASLPSMRNKLPST